MHDHAAAGLRPGSRRGFSWALRGAAGLMGLGGVLIGAVIAPQLAAEAAAVYPAYTRLARAALAYVNLGLLPFYAALVLAWRVFADIGRGRSFTGCNARRVRRAAWLAGGEAVYLLGGWLVFAHYGAAPAPVTLAFWGLTLFAAIVCLACFALAGLIDQAAELQAENDLTV